MNIYEGRTIIMMISPDSYFELYLKDKNEKEIRTIIRGLMNKIGHLKNVVEHPNYQMKFQPSEKVQISCNRSYLEKAIMTLKESGYEYIPSKKDLQILNFQENIPYINKITLEIGGIFKGFKRYEFVLQGDKYYYIEEDILMPQAQIIEAKKKASILKDDFIQCINLLYLGEWSSHYSLSRFGIVVMDGIQWRMQVEFSNNEPPFKVTGDNAYPYNFDDLEELFNPDNYLHCSI